MEQVGKVLEARVVGIEYTPARRWPVLTVCVTAVTEGDTVGLRGNV